MGYNNYGNISDCIQTNTQIYKYTLALITLVTFQRNCGVMSVKSETAEVSNFYWKAQKMSGEAVGDLANSSASYRNSQNVILIC